MAPSHRWRPCRTGRPSAWPATVSAIPGNYTMATARRTRSSIARDWRPMIYRACARPRCWASAWPCCPGNWSTTHCAAASCSNCCLRWHRRRGWCTPCFPPGVAWCRPCASCSTHSQTATPGSVPGAEQRKSLFDRIDECSQARRNVAMPGVVEADAGKYGAPVLKDAFEGARLERIAHQKVRHERDPDAIDSGIHHQNLIGQGERPFDVDRFDDAMALKLPAINQAAVKAKANAIVPMQILGNLRPAARGKVARGRDRGEAGGVRQVHRDHVLRHRVRQAYAGVEAVGNDVAQPAVGNDIKMYQRMSAQETRQYRPQYHAYRHIAGVNPDSATRCLPCVLDFVHRVRDRANRLTQFGRQTFTCIRQCDAAGGPVEQAYAQAFFQVFDRMADRRRCYLKLDGRCAEAAALCR